MPSHLKNTTRRAAVLGAVTIGVTAAAVSTVAAPASAAKVSVGPGAEIAVVAQKLGPHSANVNQCTLGFVATKPGGQKVGVTAGHCGKAGQQVAVKDLSGQAQLVVVGKVSRSTNPPTKKGADGRLMAGNPNIPDWATIDFVKGVPLSSSLGPVHPTKVAKAAVGDQVCHQGITTGWRCGKVVAVSGHRVLTDVILRPGDSGGPFVRKSDGAAVGIASTADKPDTSRGKEYSEFIDLGFVFGQAGGLTLAS
ncbi:S1 family peptidase [Tsukamurella sp. 8F]|uniref:S1 family peptidase n=1 Tax=unclassified Tsukamurella TaxID=2633480 RepID=UPI0023BA1A7B|nr:MULTISPECIES: S1 family peptidase [unclassified Tsukamurella]MDF0530884.1 S1 family peptidase [Tsukamurella sp. 8J]MDF0588171.1 S1 family peptidase [Tsukamurella sp. 8F]